MNRTKFIITLLVFFALQNFTYSQSGKLLRVEINTRLEYEIFKLVPCGESGLLLFYESTEQAYEDSKNWYFTFYNPNLKEKWTKVVPIVNNLKFKKFVIDDNFVYMYFLNTGKIKSEMFNFQIIKLSIDTEKFYAVSGVIPDKSELVDFKVHKQTAFIGLNLRKNQVQINAVNTITGKNTLLPIELNGENLLEDIFIDALDNSVLAVINNYISKRYNSLYIIKYDFNGNKISTVEVKTENKENELNSAKLLSVNKDEKIIIGTYNKSTGKTTELKENIETVSTGYYFTKIVNEKQKFINYFNFLNFKNFYSALGGREIYKIKKKAEKKKIASKDYSLNYRLLLHDIIQHDGKYILLSEAYYPEYHTVTNMVYDYYGRPIPQSYTVFDGYKFFNAIIAGFDEEGKLLWDNGFEIWNILTFYLKKHIIYYFDKNDMILAYNSEGKIASKIFENGEVVGDREYSEIDSMYPKDKIIDDENSNIIHWYNNYFICYGNQEIKNNSLPKLNKRTVFYMNKVAFN